MDQFTVYGITCPVLVGLNELLKRSGLPARFVPLSSMAMGYFFAFYYLSPDDFKRALMMGTVLGLSSIGLFSGTRSTIAGVRGKKL